MGELKLYYLLSINPARIVSVTLCYMISRTDIFWEPSLKFPPSFP